MIVMISAGRMLEKFASLPSAAVLFGTDLVYLLDRNQINLEDQETSGQVPLD